jgi:uncharacterized surface protein with fasciclin (FAS1) repeats
MSRLSARFFSSFIAAAGLLAAACSSSSSGNGGSASEDAATLQSIPATAVAAGDFKTLVAALQDTGLDATLGGAGPFTVFAPTDTAFAKLPSFLTAKLVTAPYKTELTLILGYHVLAGEVKAASILGQTLTETTVEGAKLSIDGADGKVVINGTVNVTTPDVFATNGVIHVVDGVLLPTIVDTAVGYDDGTNTFATLVTAGTFTVFAPTDKAFATLQTSLGATAYNAILADPVKLTKILTYHVLPSTVFSPDVVSGEVATVEGTDKLTLTVSGGSVTITDSTSTPANVILTDLPASNGVIHAIDKVLLPPGI